MKSKTFLWNKMFWVFLSEYLRYLFLFDVSMRENGDISSSLMFLCVKIGGTWWSSWFRHCATSPKVAGSIPDSVIGTFH